jgi:sugar-specific transcriptional regulator TrmB
MLQNELEKLGFEAKEAQLYLALLELGEGDIADIARKSGLKRTTVYHILEDLKTRGLVSQSKKGKKTRYIAEDPRSIGEEMKEKEGLYHRTLPQLLSIANFLERKPVIRYYEGLSGIKEAYKDHLKYQDSELSGWWSKGYEIFGEDYFYDYYIPERLKRKIWVRAIVHDGSFGRKQQKEDTQYLRQIRLASWETAFTEIDIHLYGKSKVSINSFQEKFALIIESKALFNTLKNIFELQWKSLE